MAAIKIGHDRDGMAVISKGNLIKWGVIIKKWSCSRSK
jgi:hypothetical protein